MDRGRKINQKIEMEALDEEEDPELQEEVAPVDKGHVVIVEVS